MTARRRLVSSPAGVAALWSHRPPGEVRGLVVLLHGAGSDSSAAPLPAVADALAAVGVRAVRLDQPGVVAGRRAPAPAARLDEVVRLVVPRLGRGLPLVLLGRSSGARVACRTAGALGARGVVALGFPWQPPARPGRVRPPDRGGELRAAAALVPVLVVQGARDPFGCPPPMPGVELRTVPGLGHTPALAPSLGVVGWVLRRLAGAAREAGPGRPSCVTRRSSVAMSRPAVPSGGDDECTWDGQDDPDA